MKDSVAYVDALKVKEIVERKMSAETRNREQQKRNNNKF